MQMSKHAVINNGYVVSYISTHTDSYWNKSCIIGRFQFTIIVWF